MPTPMRYVFVALFCAAAVLVALLEWRGNGIHSVFSERPLAIDQLQEAYAKRLDSVAVEGHGVVKKVLRDDVQGARHQRFIVALENGQTVLISHNIDIAPRIKSLRDGDTIEFSGVYEWNDRGGIVHWTHHDPRGQRAGGWLRYHGEIYR